MVCEEAKVQLIGCICIGWIFRVVFVKVYVLWVSNEFNGYSM